MLKWVVFFFGMELSPSQQEFIDAHAHEDVRALALRYHREDMPFLLAQIAGRQTAKQKIPSFYRTRGIVYPPHLSLEQASSEITARYKASLVPPGKARLVDLTGGMGVDFSLMAPSFLHACYLEQEEELCRIAAHNFALLGLKQVTVTMAKGDDALAKMEKADLIFLDPSRRDEGGRKVFRMEECSPDLTQLKELLLEKAERVMIKYSPMLDISLALRTLGEVSEVHIVSVENECKELLFILSKDAGECRYHAVELHLSGERQVFSFTREDERQEAVVTSHPGRYLYEPNAAVMKAGAFNAVGNSYKVMKLHKHSHLYTSDRLLPDFPGRIFTIDEVMVANRVNIRRYVSQTEKVNIAVRNYPISVAEIRRKTGLKDGGEDYLFATTLADGQKVWIITRKV